MARKDPRIDAYIASARDFAKPILKHLRRAVHEGCPAVEETMKWSRPHFAYRGMLAGMSAFREHCAFGFWKGALVVGDAARGTGGMGQLGRITSLSDLPPKSTLVNWTRTAASLNERGVKPERRTKSPKKSIAVPADFAARLKQRAAVRAAFDAFSPSARREYLEWITEAKSGETRARRIDIAVGWIAEGKRRNWKYER